MWKITRNSYNAKTFFTDSDLTKKYLNQLEFHNDKMKSAQTVEILNQKFEKEQKS